MQCSFIGHSAYIQQCFKVHKYVYISWFHTFAVFWMFYSYFWVIPRRLTPGNQPNMQSNISLYSYFWVIPLRQTPGNHPKVRIQIYIWLHLLYCYMEMIIHRGWAFGIYKCTVKVPTIPLRTLRGGSIFAKKLRSQLRATVKFECFCTDSFSMDLHFESQITKKKKKTVLIHRTKSVTLHIVPDKRNRHGIRQARIHCYFRWNDACSIIARTKYRNGNRPN